MAMGHYDQAKGVPDALYDQLRGSHSSIPVMSIEVGARERGLDSKVVDTLYESIENTGLHQPIGVRDQRDRDGKLKIHLVWGNHRLAAWRKKFEEGYAKQDEKLMARWGQIPVIRFPEDMTDDMALLLEVKENLERKELTTGQRESAMARRAEIMERRGWGGAAKKDDVAKLPAATLAAPSLENYSGAKRNSADYRLLQRRYAEYKKAHHGKAWNKQTKKEFDAFVKWQQEAERREAEAEKEAKAEAEEKDLNKAVSDDVTRIDANFKKWGRDYLDQIQMHVDSLRGGK